MSFYIEKIIVTGSGKTDSIIELSNGVNIIYGPSNTGKTYIVKCIDYMFGSEREPIDISTGYQYIKIIVRTQCGTITMSRKIGENKIEVSSNDNNVPSGKYATKASRTVKVKSSAPRQIQRRSFAALAITLSRKIF